VSQVKKSFRDRLHLHHQSLVWWKYAYPKSSCPTTGTDLVCL